MIPAIDVRDVTVRYGDVLALDGATLSIERGRVCGLIGMNGSGKSTLFKTIMGMLRPDQGDVLIDGDQPGRARRTGRVGYVPQREDVDWSFPISVRDVVMMGRYGHMGFLRRARPQDRAAVDQALERVGMTEFRHRQIGELSGGQKKRVFLARALAQGAAVILLDEPFTGVDVKTEDAIIALLRQMRDEGRVMLVSTHDLGSVPEFCDRVVLVKGTVLAHGPTAEVFTPQNLRLAFGGVLRHLVLGAGQIHDDDDPRELTMLSDDERPLVFYDGKARTPEAAPK